MTSPGGGLDAVLTLSQQQLGVMQPRPSATLHVGGDIRIDGKAYRASPSGGWELIETPPGALTLFAGSAAPTGWLVCDGSPVSRSTYADLFAAIGVSWGAGNGSTTFNLPDLRGRVPVGVSASHALGSVGGEEAHTLTTGEMPAHGHTATQPTHTHGIFDPNHLHTVDASGRTYDMKITGAGGSNQYQNAANQAQTVSLNLNQTAYGSTGINGTNAGGADAVTVNSNGSGTAHNVMQPFATVNYIIKA